jgi:hypothetical protein
VLTNPVEHFANYIVEGGEKTYLICPSCTTDSDFIIWGIGKIAL